MKKNDRDRRVPLLTKTIRIMKVTSLCNLLAVCSISASTYAQSLKFSIHKQNSSISEVFKEIEKKSDFTFFFNDNQINVKQKVNVSANNASIEDVLAQVLQNTGYNYQIIDKQILIKVSDKEVMAVPAVAQSSKKITGTVLDATGMPVIGANVMVKGTTNGTITDMDGKFSLEVEDGAVLQVSYIGFANQEIKVGNQTSLSIAMKEDAEALDELVVVGFGTQKKVNVIGSIVQVGKEKLENRSTPMLANALTGQMSGVTIIQRSGQPGVDSNDIQVRGVGSFGATPSALVLIDGIPGSLNDVNSEDVESISVLKDASTAAIYGSRAANGVILVTTKTGMEGKISVSYNGYVGFNRPTELPAFVDTWRYAELYNQAAGNEVYSQDDILKFKNGADLDHFANEKYLDNIFSNNGIQTGHDLTLNGGNNANKYMLSFGYLRQNGLVENNDYERYNARVNVVNDILSNLKLTTRLSGVLDKRNEPYVPGSLSSNNMLSIISDAVRFPGIYPTVLSNGNYSPGTMLQGTPVAHVNSGSFYENPKFSINANMRLDYKPIEDLTISAIGAYQYTNNEEKTYRSTLKLDGDQIIGPSSLSHLMSKTIYKTFQATVDYNKTFGKHNIGALLGYSWEQEDFENVKGFRDKFPSNDLPYLDSGSPDNQKSNGTSWGWAILSYFGRLKYNFNERYLLETTVRYDGSSRFPKNNRFGLFPSVAGGWRISEESFFKEYEQLSWISNLKLKASWGRLGNQNISNYPYQTVYSLGQDYPFGGTLSQGAAVMISKDQNIRWEETETIDVGLETSLWNGLFNFNISYFYRNTYDILYKPAGSISSILGLGISEVNTGKLKNTGCEIELGHHNQIGDFKYNINGNLSVINNEVVSLGLGNVEQLNGLVGNGSDLFIGYPMQMYYGYKTDGVFLDQNDIDNWHDQSKVTPNPRPGDIRYQDISGPDGVPDGKIDPNYDRVPLGSRIPKFTFGLNIGMEYKNWDFSALFQGVAGVKGYLNNYAGFAFKGESGIQTWQADGAFDPQNPVRYPNYPRLELIATSTPNTEMSDFWILDASYIRLKNVSLGYTLPKNILSKCGISNLRVYIQAENPLTWNKYRQGWDPEINTGGSYYPILSTYTFGVNFKF